MALSRAKYKRRSGEENKNPNNLKVTVLKQVSKNLLPDKFSENRFFLSCIGIGDLYSKSLLSIEKRHFLKVSQLLLSPIVAKQYMENFTLYIFQLCSSGYKSTTPNENNQQTIEIYCLFTTFYCFFSSC